MKVFSFDIFDTCVTRRVAHPSDLFVELASQVLQDIESCKGTGVSALAQGRAQAEKRARIAGKPREDIVLADVYRNFPELVDIGITPSDMLELELSIERKALVPVEEIKNRIHDLRLSGRRIIFISDMYLPSDFIRGFLEDFGIASPKDRIYVSGEIGLLKHSGNLFKYVLRQEGIAAGDLEHVGDNLGSDIKVPGRLGIAASHYTGAALNCYEKRIRQGRSNESILLSRLSGASRVARLTSSHVISGLASGVIGPFLTAFVEWVLREAQEKGIQRLYFVSRDGHVMHEIANKLVAGNSGHPECRYFYGSRQAWLLPSVTRVDRSSLDWLIYRDDYKSPRYILKKLDISPEEIERELGGCGIHRGSFDDQLSDKEIECFWRLLETSRISNLVLERAAAARELALDYFEQEGLFSGPPWAIVDTGWRLTSQRSLKRLLNFRDKNAQVHGYYIGVRRDRVADVGTVSPFISATEGHAITGKKHPWLFDQGTASVIEELFTMSRQQPLLGYRDTGSGIAPSFSQDKDTSIGLDFYDALRGCTLCYAREIADLKLNRNELDIFIDGAVESAGRFFCHPRKEEVERIKMVPVDVDQLHESALSRQLASPLTFFDLQRMVEYHVRPTEVRFSDPDHAWYRGSAALSNPVVRGSFFALNQFRKLINRAREDS